MKTYAFNDSDVIDYLLDKAFSKADLKNTDFVQFVIDKVDIS